MRDRSRVPMTSQRHILSGSIRGHGKKKAMDNEDDKLQYKWRSMTRSRVWQMMDILEED